MKPLKAYEVYDGGDNWAIRFATNSATARREGANECGCEFHEVDHCRRKPELDQYAPGPVPAAALIAAGWSYECGSYDCSNPVFQDTEGMQISAAGTAYCCEACMAQDFARQRGRAAAESALIELVQARMPGCHVASVHVYGRRLEAARPGFGARCIAYLTFPGAQYGAEWVFGEDGPRIHADDLPALRALYPDPDQGAAL
jgi:hypothetical protein